MGIKLLPNLSRNLPCDVATLQSLLDNATDLLENHQKGINEVWATDHTPPFLRYGGFLELEGSDSISFPHKYRLHPREEFTIIFRNFTREHINGGFWLVLGQTTSAATLCMSLEEPFADNPGEILFKISDGTTISSALSIDFDLRHHENVELAIVYNGSTISFYKNSVLINAVNVVAEPINYSGQLFIGGDHSGTNEINSYLRDWSFWGKAFSAGEITTYYGNHTDPYPDELRIELAIDEASGTTITDSADATKWGIAFDDSTIAPVEHQEEIICVDNFTLLGECYWHENAFTDNTIMAKGSEAGTHCQYRVAVEKATQKLKFSYYDGAAWTHVLSDLTVRAGHYSKWAIRISGTSLEFYIDGVWDVKTIGITLRSNYEDLTFGYEWHVAPVINRWHGHLRNIGIANTALTNGEVTDFFAGTMPTSIQAYWTLRNGAGNTFVSDIVVDANDFSRSTTGTISHDIMQQVPVEGSWLVNLYVTNLAGISMDIDIFSKLLGGTTDFRLYADSSKKLVFQTIGPNTNTDVSTHILTEFKWFEALITLKRNALEIIMNGVTYSNTITDVLRTVSTGDLLIGIDSGGPFPGFISRYKQWDRALKADETDKMLYERIVPTSGLVVDCKINEGTGAIFNDVASDYRLDI